jgi:hypothetical protein
MTRFRAAAFGLLLLLGPVSAGPYEEGIAAYDRLDFAAALNLWLPLAEQGDSAAQFNVGVLYEKGLGVAQDMREAARWYRKAAEQGDAEAQYDMGRLHETGAGVSMDPEEARKWYAAVIANARKDATTATMKQRARVRLANLANATEHVVPYKGGRFVIARSPDGSCVVALQGPITRDTAPSFAEVIKQSSALGCANPWLLLESPGGLLFDGLDLGRQVRSAGFRTITRYSCASACSMIFLGGTERVLVGSRARIGLHQPSRGTGSNRLCDPTTYTSAARDMAAYVQSSIPGHAEEVINLIMQTSCDEITWIGGRRALDLTIATRVESEGVDVFGSAERRRAK